MVRVGHDEDRKIIPYPLVFSPFSEGTSNTKNIIMADQNTDTEDKKEGANLPEGQGNESEGNTEKPDTEGATSGDDNAEEGDEGDEGGEEGDDINEDEEPATRKSAHNAFHAGQRIARKQVKEEKPEDGKGEEGDDEEGNGGKNEGGDQKTDPTNIQDAVAEALKPFTDKMVEQETKDEVDNYISENPEFKPYAKKIMKFANHPTRKHLPIETVALEAVGRKGLLQIGAKRAQEADAEGKQTQSGGTSTRNAPSGKSVKDMSLEEFEDYQNNIRFGSGN